MNRTQGDVAKSDTAGLGVAGMSGSDVALLDPLDLQC